jgi:hypothetical protein
VRFQQSYFVVDADLRLLWIGGDWDDFSQANGGKGALVNDVLSTPLRDHITDDETADALAEMIGAVQQANHMLRIDYRCDSPQQLRRFLLTIQPMKDSRALLVHELRDASIFKKPLTPWQADQTAEDCKCSFCCSVRTAGGRWTAPEGLEGDHPPLVRYTLCPDCTQNIKAAIKQVVTGAKPKTPVTRGFGP